MTAGRAALMALLALAACRGDLSMDDLEDLLLRPEDVPAGLVLDPGASGLVEELADAFRVDGGVDPSVEEGFVEGRENTYVATRRPQPGQLAFAGSLALLFEDRADAREFMAFARGFQLQEVPTADELPADGLGDAGYGVHYPPDRDGNESYGYVWRVGEVVLTVALGGPVGSADPVETLALAERLDDRVP